MIPFPNFEVQIDPKILYRGKEYHYIEAVTELTEVNPGEWEACVEGTELYNVEISILGNQIDSWFCDCPYDGAVCKHVVATLFAIREQQEKASTFLSVEEVNDTVENYTSPADKLLQEVLDRTDKEKIIDFICSYATEHPSFAGDVQKHFVPTKNTDHLSAIYDSGVGKSYVFHNVRSFRHRYDDYYSDIDYEATAHNLSRHLQKARILFQAQASGDAAALAIQILEVIADNYDESEYNYYEDNGFLNLECENACEFLLDIIRHPATSRTLKSEIRIAINELKDKEAFQDGAICPIEDFVHDVNIHSMSKEEAIEYLTEKISLQTDNHEKAQYVREKIDLLRETGREEEAYHTTLQYLLIPEIRLGEIERLMGLGKYQDALILANNGIESEQKSKEQYYLIQFKKVKLQLLAALNRREELIEAGRELFILQNGDMDVYHLLKKYVAADLWKTFLTKMMMQTKFTFDQIEPQIYVEEKEYDKLMAWVTKISAYGIDNINTYLPHLKAHYPDELLNLYTAYVLNYAQKNIGRGHYQHIAQILKRMKTIKKGTEIVNTIITEFRATYKNRRAMMEVLSGFK